MVFFYKENESGLPGPWFVVARDRKVRIKPNPLQDGHFAYSRTCGTATQSFNSCPKTLTCTGRKRGDALFRDSFPGPRTLQLQSRMAAGTCVLHRDHLLQLNSHTFGVDPVFFLYPTLGQLRQTQAARTA